jgi:hypothetical protein
VIFIPSPAAWHPPTVKNIEPGISYRAFYFDPKSGKEHELGGLQPDSAGSWKLPMAPTFADWVLVMEKKS